MALGSIASLASSRSVSPSKRSENHDHAHFASVSSCVADQT